MAARKPGKVAAPVKQKLRKKHGPKRHLFCEYKPMVHVFAAAGVLNKYSNYQSFCLSCQARGVRSNTDAMWQEFRVLEYPEQKEYFKNIKANEKRIADFLAREKNKKNKKK